MATDPTPHGDPAPTTTSTPATPAAPPEPAQAPAATPGQTTETPETQPTDWKSEARKWEQRAKDNRETARANEAAARRLKEIEDAQKSEAEKTAERIAALEAENRSFKEREQVAAWSAEVAEAAGVPANLLRGSTKEELEAHAAELKAVLTPATPPVSAPQPVPTIGQHPQNPGNISLPEQIAAATAAGDHALVARLKAVQLGG